MVNTPSSGIYWNIIKNLNSETKLDLINKLSASLLKTVSNSNRPSRNWAKNLAGRWQDERTTDEIISDIREARTINREIDL